MGGRSRTARYLPRHTIVARLPGASDAAFERVRLLFENLHIERASGPVPTAPAPSSRMPFRCSWGGNIDPRDPCGTTNCDPGGRDLVLWPHNTHGATGRRGLTEVRSSGAMLRLRGPWEGCRPTAAGGLTWGASRSAASRHSVREACYGDGRRSGAGQRSTVVSG